MNDLIIKSYFSGADLFDIGINQAGLEITESFEIDQVYCSVQRFIYHKKKQVN